MNTPCTVIKDLPESGIRTGASGNSHVCGRLDEWGGSSNPFRGTETGKLHCPSFEEWMLGLPMGLTALTPLEMPRFQSWLRLHGISYTPPTQGAEDENI